MKHFQLNDMIKWKDTNIPQAFPGQYPTRIAYMVVFNDDSDLHYIGKPNTIAVKKYLKAKERPDVRSWGEWEFDRGNLLTVRVPARAHQKTHSTLAKLYHPFRTADGIGSFAAPFWRKRISGFTCYSPFETLKLPMVKEHKAWLVASGIVKGKEIPKQEPTPPPTTTTRSGIWRCECGWYNAPEQDLCASCAAPPSEPAAPSPAPEPSTRPNGDWRCENCTWWNNPTRSRCRNCDRERTQPPQVETINGEHYWR